VILIWLICALPVLYFIIEDRQWDGRFGVRTALIAMTCAAIGFALIGAWYRN
jgi:hypothetical protein